MRMMVFLCACLLASSSSYAGMINGGFESNLAGWIVGGTAGNVQILNSGDFAASDASMSIAAAFGSHYALLSTGAGDRGGSPRDTSVLSSIPYLVGAGGSISFVLDFFTNELPTASGGSPDFYSVSVLRAGLMVATIANQDVNSAQTTFPAVDCSTVFLTAPDGTTVCSHSGRRTFTNVDLSAYAASVVQFRFLVSDAGDNSFDSALLVDGVEGVGLTDASVDVPEPRTWTLLASAALLAPVLFRRRRNGVGSERP